MREAERAVKSILKDPDSAKFSGNYWVTKNNNIMQVLPHFASYKILEQYPILKDDTGNEFCLTLFNYKKLHICIKKMEFRIIINI